jgi:hypothetical protein
MAQSRRGLHAAPLSLLPQTPESVETISTPNANFVNFELCPKSNSVRARRSPEQPLKFGFRRRVGTVRGFFEILAVRDRYGTE